MTHPLEHRPRADHTPPLVLSTLGLAEGLYLVTSRSTGALAFVAVGVSAVAAIAGLPWRVAAGWLTALRTVTAVALPVTLVLFVLRSSTPFPSRVALVALTLGFVAAALGLLLHWGFKARLLPVTAGLCFLASPLLALEALLGRQEPVPGTDAGNIAAPAPDSTGRYKALSVLASVYPDDLRGYLDPTREGQSWELFVLDSNSSATLDRAVQPRTMRVRIDRTNTDVSWNVQLVKEPLRLEKGREYVFTLSTKSDQLRTGWVHLTGGTAPWPGLGLSAPFDSDTIWRIHRFTFRVTESDSAARLRLDLSLSTVPIEVRDAVLREAGTERRVEAGGDSVRYEIPYRFNALGCRGPDYSIPKDPVVRRVLVLGDSYTLGAGVREGDAYPGRLDHVLNTESRTLRSSVRYEVINCGVTGFGTADARRYYEESLRRYTPDLVILGMVAGDEARRADDLPDDPGRSRSRLGQLLATVAWFERRREESREQLPDLRALLAEVDSLRASVRSDGSRFAIVVLQDRPSRRWTQLDSALTTTYPDSVVPVLNVGPRIMLLSLESRTVHPLLDGHPNHDVHRIVGDAVGSFVLQRVLNSDSVVTPPRDSAGGRRGSRPARSGSPPTRRQSGG